MAEVTRILAAFVFVGALSWVITTALMPPLSWPAAGIVFGWLLRGLLVSGARDE